MMLAVLVRQEVAVPSWLTYTYSEEAGEYKGAKQQRDNQRQGHQGIKILGQAVLQPSICVSAGAPCVPPGAACLLGWQRLLSCLLPCTCTYGSTHAINAFTGRFLHAGELTTSSHQPKWVHVMQCCLGHVVKQVRVGQSMAVN